MNFPKDVLRDVFDNGFTPILPEIILKDYGGDNTLSWYDLVGGDVRHFAPSGAQHVLGWGFFQKGNDEYLIVSLRLLANAGAPIYSAVAGTLTPEQSMKASMPNSKTANPMCDLC